MLSQLYFSKIKETTSPLEALSDSSGEVGSYNPTISDTRTSEQGAFALFAAMFILPLLFFGYTISLDLNQFLTKKQQTRRIMDEAAMHAYHYFPNSEKTLEAAQRFIDLYGFTGKITAEIQENHDTITLKSNVSHQLSFPKLFGLDLKLPVNLKSSVRGIPLDTFIIVDASSYMAPKLSSDTPWGNGYIPSPNFNNQYRVSANPLVLTQQCYNPLFSAVKLAAISIFEEAKSFSLNTIGLGFSPASAPFEISRHTPFPGGIAVVRNNIRGSDSIHNNAESFIENDFYEDVSSVDCAEAAKVTENYHAPLISSNQNTLSYNNRSGHYEFDREWLNQIKAAEAIWYRAADKTLNSDAVHLFSQIGISLFGSRNTERGGLATNTYKLGIILSGDLPHINGLRATSKEDLAGLSQGIELIRDQVVRTGLRMKIYYVIASHKNHPNGLGTDTLESETAFLKEYFDRIEKAKTEGRGKLNIQLLTVPSPKQLQRELSGAILNDKKTVLLKS